MSANKETEHESLWEDRAVKFDVPASALKLRPGEMKIEEVDEVEDTKGNNGDKGKLIVTNLRLVWIHNTNPRINLSIGYLNFVNTSMINIESKLKGSTESLKILTRYSKTKFEFIFSNLLRDMPWLHGLIKNVVRAYETSRLYRDIKLKGPILDNGQLRMLPKEEVYNKLEGVWNLSSEHGTLGTIFISNIRVVWIASMNDNFNLSLPFIQIKNVSLRDSKFGKALVLESSALSGGYLLGFRLDPPSKLKEVLMELQSLHAIFTAAPILGVEVESSPITSPSDRANASESLLTSPDQIVEEVETVESVTPACAYLGYLSESARKDPVYSEELGLAVECLPDDVSISSLWEIIPTASS